MSESSICEFCKKELKPGERIHPECIREFASKFQPYNPATGLKKWLEEKQKNRDKK